MGLLVMARQAFERRKRHYTPEWARRSMPWWLTALFFVAIFAAMIIAVKVGAG
jgi:hypothetical protein